MLTIALTTLALGLTVGYAALQAWFLLGWWRTPRTPVGTPRRRWSIVIAARDEAPALADASWDALLPALAPTWQSFGVDGIHTQAAERVCDYQVIVVDDHSGDGTAAAARGHAHVEVLVLPKGVTGKKAALAHGIGHATGDWIATLDADVRVRQDWLRNLDAATVGRVAVAGPVELTGAGWFARWQALDFCGMMLITGASLRHGRFAMGNGANLAFAKTAFAAVGGYASEDGRESASGDDMVLLGKLLRAYPGQVGFAKDPRAVVRTAAQPTLAGFVQQRWRWSAKTGLNHQPALTATLAMVWLFHVGLFGGLPLAAAGVMPWAVVGGAWAAKLLVDLAVLRAATRFFWRFDLLRWSYPLDGLAHAGYVAAIGTLALLPLDFEWKGRRWRR